MGVFSRFLSRLGTGATVLVQGAGARSRPWLREIEEQEICTSILDCNATHTAKGQVLHVVMDKEGRIREVRRSSSYTKLFERPNPFMTRQDFLYAMSWQLDARNTAMAWIDWQEGRPAAIWPIAYQNYQIREIQGGGYAVQFLELDGDTHILPLEDMVILRRHYDGSGMGGRSNSPVEHAISLVGSVDDGLTEAVSVSNRIHGLLKQKKAMLAPEAVTKAQEEFKKRVQAAIKNGDGIVTLDATEDYTPLTVTAWAANAAQMQQISGRLHAYWRTPEEVVLNTASEQTMQNYYDSIIEPRWAELSQAFTSALFTRRELDTGNRIMVFGGAATGASWQTKLTILLDTRDSGELTINERRDLLGYGPVEGGDKRMVSLNFVEASKQNQYQLGEKPKEEENAVQT